MPVDKWINRVGYPLNTERKQNLSVQFPGASSLTRGLRPVVRLRRALLALSERRNLTDPRYATCTDIDPMVADMAFIQLSLLGIPAKVVTGNPDADVIARVRGEENTDGQEIKAAAGVRSELEGADKTAGEQSRASRVIADLANSERDMLRAAENTERGRMPEREEQTLTRTIQKER